MSDMFEDMSICQVATGRTEADGLLTAKSAYGKGRVTQGVFLAVGQARTQGIHGYSVFADVRRRS